MDRYDALKEVLTAAGCKLDEEFGDIAEFSGRRCCVREMQHLGGECLREKLVYLLSEDSPENTGE